MVSPRGMLEPWAFNHRRWLKRAAWTGYQKRDLASAAAVHVTSEAEAESVRQLGVMTPLAVISNGVDVPVVLPTPIPGARRRALFLSRIHPKKGLPTLIEAWRRLSPAGWELAIAGTDELGHRAEIEKLVRDGGLSDVVVFLGPIPTEETLNLYRTADLFVLPTYSENFGLVVAEALSAGVPVLTTTGAPWAVLETEQCGWWVPPDVESISAALAEATSLTPLQRTAMGKRGRRYVADALGWTEIGAQMAAVYSWLVGTGERPSTVHVS